MALWYTTFMSKEQQTVVWMNMMMTAVRRRLGLSRAEFVPLASKYDVVHFLIEQYELLHYYDNDYIVNDVLKYIEEQGGDMSGLSRTG